MTAVQRDPKVLSVLEKKRGERGYRELQGEALRELLVQLVAKQVSSEWSPCIEVMIQMVDFSCKLR